MSIVSDLMTPARETATRDDPSIVLSTLIPEPRVSAEVADIAHDVLEELRHISECYRACRAKADMLRSRASSGDAEDRRSREDLVRSLQRLHELRERRSALLDTYDLPSSAGRAS